MDEKTKEVLASEVDAIVEKPTTIEIDIVCPKPTDRLKFLLGFPRKRIFQLRPLVLGNLARISQRLLKVDMPLLDGSGNLLVSNYEAMSAHSEALAEIVAIGLTNGRHEPKKSLTNFLMENMTSAELLTVVSHIIRMMDIGSFMNTIISAKGMSLLNPEGIIASGEQ